MMDIDALRKDFRQCPETGKLFRVNSHQRPDLVGKEAGYIDNCGYYRVAWRGRKYLRSHLSYALAYGRLPQARIDHINRDRTDDSPENLREVDAYENMWNRTPMKRDLPMGVTRKDGKFEAKIMHKRQLFRLGKYSTPQDAAAAYQAKREALYGKFA